jgi:2-dehydro-3-deoxy-D-gluconate 5-dehydrogenase
LNATFQFEQTGRFNNGGNGGIGLGIAKGFASSGAAVVIAARNQRKAQLALSELHSLGAQAEFVELDVLTEASCHRAIERAVKQFGRLDILVNNAGTNIRKAPEELTAQDWNLVMNTNLTSAFLCSQSAYPHMLRAGGGKIINIGSMISIFGMPFATAYAASKGGIVQMTRAMATDRLGQG